MTIEKDFLLLCKEISKDVSSDLININGVIENLNTESLPVFFSPIAVVGRFIVKDSGNNELLPLKLVIKNPRGKIISPDEQDTSLPIKSNEKTQRLGVLGSLGGVEFDEYGEYEFSIELNGDIIATTIFSVIEGKTK